MKNGKVEICVRDLWFINRSSCSYGGGGVMCVSMSQIHKPSTAGISGELRMHKKRVWGQQCKREENFLKAGEKEEEGPTCHSRPLILFRKHSLPLCQRAHLSPRCPRAPILQAFTEHLLWATPTAGPWDYRNESHMSPIFKAPHTC